MGSLGINGWNLVIQLIAFIIFIWLLWRFALGPIVRILDERQERIRESMAAAEKMRADLQATAQRNEEVLLEARRDAQQIITNARQVSEATMEQAREQASTQAEAYLTRAEETLRRETEQARQQLRQEVADLAVLAAGRIVRKELDPETQSRLIQETLAEAVGTRSNNGAEGA
ncbi:MAG: F0F1 ATP synthase subunit B [Chloroflexia bacterium]|jgi:F-type H+-transporting ATPase subunit b|nr:F0F1 ATP synthase subunit B [Chloroflexia bacterium]